ncbi:hypothetical protein BYT27DRAFT_7258907 [Phlegmacium glaucopus]|nr:hypothetical protein BYT27DRAFT_7258907 [Phlegmacium glaucopus]
MIIWSPEAGYSPALTPLILAGRAWTNFLFSASSSSLQRDDQELQELCAKVRVLEARPVDHAKIMRDLEERHAELEITFKPNSENSRTTSLLDMLDKEVARVVREGRAEAVGAELNGNIVCCEKQHERFTEAPMTRRKNRIKNIVNGYPEWKKDEATFEKLEDLEALKELSGETMWKQRNNSTNTLVFRTNFLKVKLEESFMSRFGPHYQSIPSLCSYRCTFSSTSAIVNASATSRTTAMMSLDLKLQFAAMKDLAPAKY